MKTLTLNKNNIILYLKKSKQRRGSGKPTYRLYNETTISELIQFLGNKTTHRLLCQNIHARLDHCLLKENKTLEETKKFLEGNRAHDGITKAEATRLMLKAIEEGKIEEAQKLKAYADSKSRNRSKISSIPSPNFEG